MIIIENLEPTFSNFPDGERNISLQPSLKDFLDNIGDSVVDINWKFEGNHEIMDLALLLDVITAYYTHKIHVHIPFLPYSRMDRRERGKNNPCSLLVFAGLLRGMVESTEADIAWSTNDAHDESALEYLPVHIQSCNKIRVLAQKVFQHYGFNENTLVVFPDKGAKARYEGSSLEQFINEYCGGLDIVVGEKERDFDTHKITSYKLPDGDYSKYFRAVIFDDVISYGNTFIKLHQAIQEKGIKLTELVTSHAEDALWRGDLTQQEGLHISTTPTLNHHTGDGNVALYNI